MEGHGLDPEGVESLDHAELVGLVRMLVERVGTLEAENEALRCEIEGLRRDVGRDSTNSGLPPATDDKAAREKRAEGRRKPIRAEGRRKPGKQPGGEGNTLSRVSDPDRTILHRPPSCGGCGASTADAVTVRRQARQVFDVPEPRVEVTEHQVETCRCACGAETTAPWPAEATGTSTCWGPSVRAMAVYLVVAQHLPYGRAAQVLTDLVGAPVSKGTVVAWVEGVAAALDAFEATVKALLQTAGVAHFDETGCRVHDGTDTHYVHVSSTALLALLVVHKNRGRQAMTDIGILPAFTGTAVHDGYQRYWDFEGVTAHQKCGAHLVRNLAAVAEVAAQAAWSDAMADLLREANRACHQARDAGQTSLDAGVLHAVRSRYGRLVALGYRANPPPEHRARDSLERESYNLVRRLDRHRDDVLRFCIDLSVPFTNNEGERDVRPVKIHQKVSYLWRSLRHAQHWCLTRSYISTLRKNDQPVLDQLRNAVTGTPWLPTQAW